MSRFDFDEGADQVAPVRAWLRAEPISVVVMQSVWMSEYGTAYAPTTGNYRRAVAAVALHLWDRGDVPAPLWFGRRGWDSGDVTPWGARLADALAFHVAHMYGIDSAGWAVVLDRRYASYGAPVLASHSYVQPLIAVRALLRVVRGDEPVSAMAFPFTTMPELLKGVAPDPRPTDADVDVAKARRAAKPRLGGLLGKGAPTWHIDVPPLLAEAPPVAEIVKIKTRELSVEELIQDVEPSDRKEFTFLVSVHEAALHQWGEAAYGRYEAALAAQPGIEAVEGEDREQFYVLAPSLTAEQVLAAARAAAPRR
ncbi:hypothetical protein [Demequina globuliformis]|uniref:hypothetical protein n=1 Tax=Demequina globuliformis TaxID=676202 RepID=UPI000780EA59|nr:hypothetical protein [Demequina globuliformis]